MKAILVIVIMSGGSGVTSQQIEFPSIADCQLAQRQELVWGGDHPDYPPDTRHFCIEVPDRG